MTLVRVRAAVLGSPIEHSLSPVLHRAAYSQLGLDGWEYTAIECTEADFPAWFAEVLGRAGWAGLSLTMPLKRVVLPLLEEISDLAAAVGAVNTVLLAGSGAGRVRGENTDVAGILAALAEIGVGEAGDGVVLGGGATAASALAALAELGCRRPLLLVRDPARALGALEAGRRLGVDPQVGSLADAAGRLTADVWISTLPGTAGDAVAAQLRTTTAPRRLPPLLDVTYAPWPTSLGQHWLDAGSPVVGGLSMLVHQAARQVALMTGRVPDVEGMRSAALAAIARA